METRLVPIERLEPHPNNSNVMTDTLRKKLTRHIQRTGRYPPLIVRPLGQLQDDDDDAPGHGAQDAPVERYQVIDGHHRLIALRELGHATARCDVWDVDDEQTLTLLATLNRLEGRDDPQQRAALLERLKELRGVEALRQELPEKAERLQQALQARQPPPTPAPPTPREAMAEAVHFFLYPRQRRALEQKLNPVNDTRDRALLRITGIDPDEPGLQ